MKNWIYEDCLYSDSVTVSFDFESGCIDVEMKNDGMCDVSVFHFDNDRSSGMIESAILDSMPDWNSIQSEVEEGERENREFQDYLWRNSRYW